MPLAVLVMETVLEMKGVRLGNVQFFLLIIIFHLATSLRYVRLMMSPERFDYSSIRHYTGTVIRTGNDIMTL
jgi:hypothetical protein